MDIAALARLAKLDLTPDEEATLRPQLESILAEFQSLADLPTVPLAIHPGQGNNLRDDTVVPSSNDLQNKLLSSSAYQQANFLRLPSVF